MTTDSFLAIMCVSVLLLFFGSVVAFMGYRFFLLLLPVLGFIWGFFFGAQMIQAIFGTGFLSDVTSWVVGFIFALVFAALSYVFYFMAIAILAGGLGYSLGVGLMGAIGFDFGFLTWLVGAILAVVFAVGVLVLNIQKWVIIGATSLLGAGIILGTFLALFGKLPPQDVAANPVRTALDSSPLWFILFLAVAVMGFVVQYQASRNRMDDFYPTESSAAAATPVTPEQAPPGSATPGA
jgi:hypothetical protein